MEIYWLFVLRFNYVHASANLSMLELNFPGGEIDQTE